VGHCPHFRDSDPNGGFGVWWLLSPHPAHTLVTQTVMQKISMSLLIQEVPVTNAPIELLLLADPSEDKIHSYLSGSKCFIASSGAVVVGACVVQPRGTDTHELMSIAVHPAHQKSGYGTALLKWVIDYFRVSGARQLEVGTGTFGYQLAFYQRHGFRVTSIDHDFFVKNYPEPIFEDGIQLFDMLRLTLRYSGNAA
jgi:ribosomal protein S18 acetylase RimI-like enzyme